MIHKYYYLRITKKDEVMMKSSETRNILHAQIETIHKHESWTITQKNKALFEVFTLILEEATKDERLNFTTLFSRLAFVGAKFQLSGNTLHHSHMFRKAIEQGKINPDKEGLYYDLGAYICESLLNEICKTNTSHQYLLSQEAKQYFVGDQRKMIGFKPVVEAVLYEVDAEKKHLYFYDEEDPANEKTAIYDVHDKNEQFNQNIESLRKTFSLPIHINLIDVEIREDGMYVPTAIIIQPDHLMDVTAIAECFKDYGSEPFLYLISKYKPAESTPSLLIGNLVNFMLDELVSDPQVEFKTLLMRMFHTNPLGFAILDDQSVKDLMDKIKNHFKNLQYVVLQEFKTFEINRETIFLEPSFYSRDFGIQGRLDLLHQKKDKVTYDIIELKSGSTFKPNVYGINASHYIQTLLYDLMIKSTFQTRARSVNYILYSKESDNPLRFAPPVRNQQYEAMKLRNDLLAIDQKLKTCDSDNAILQYVKPLNFPKLKGFNIKDIENFYNVYATLNTLDKLYFDHYSAFVSREQSLAKTGEHGINKSNGHAALWLENSEEKKERFALLSGLTIIDNRSYEHDAIITFAINAVDINLVNFRIGDITVLYPMDDDKQRPVLSNQIFKCTITDMTNEIVTVRLRSKQYNQTLFTTEKNWSLEQDSLDSGFNTMFKSLFTWAAAPLEFRELLLGVRAPRFHDRPQNIKFDSNVTAAQSEILNRILTAKDYFLLWGPPGTGKTSVMLKNLVKHLYSHTRENILLLAYTNRAVDEICEAVMSIDSDFKDKFLRLGSRLSTDERYENNLLDQVIKNITSRQEIIELLMTRRIYISTVSSVVNKVELFHLKDFDTVIIDEASQILEPMLVGLLSKFKRFIFIGDHKQLPAVVIQPGYQSKISNDIMNEAGFKDTRTSLFERLYFQIQQNGWQDAIGILQEQGRLNEALVVFPNQYFYEEKLRLLPGLKRLSKQHFFYESPASLKFLAHHRTIYIDTPPDTELNWKTNIFEAETTVDTIQQLIELYKVNKKNITNESIGVITPYRAQIARIRQCMQRLPAEIADKITVDTVERYQGGARDIIIISFCVNKLSQLDTLVSHSLEGIDRKLNVALTRAREHIILIGNRELLSRDEVYAKLLESYQEYTIEP